MMDQLLEAWVAGLVETAKLKWMMGSGSRWRPGEKLKLLFAGYNGTRNTGADVRVEEMMRQIAHILGPERVELSVLSQNFNRSRGYFGNAKQVLLPDIFPPFLYREIPKYDGVVACEGSMFKSKFANALTTMMIGSLGMASAHNRLSVGYGAEAGHMDPLLAQMCSRYCRDSLVITRNEESRTVLRELGIACELGTDTAWTFEPHPPSYAENVLRKCGWDGKMPLLALCPINPFWWPVRASLLKGIARATTGAFKKSHYRSIYFHNAGPEVDKAYQRYLIAFARSVEIFCKDYPVFPILASMEMLDADACHRVAAMLGGAVPVFRADAYDMYQMVSVLRRCDMMVSSRFHGIVTAMPGLVASAGITMDERIRNLMRERGQPELLMEVDDPDLEEKLGIVLRRLVSEKESIQAAVGKTVVSNLKTMARMGVYFEEHVQRRYPEFPVHTGVRGWENYLPPLSPNLQRLVETHGG